MTDAITRHNETARQRALDSGQNTYQHEMITTWPACAVCATPIRHRPGERGSYRQCVSVAEVEPLAVPPPIGEAPVEAILGRAVRAPVP